MTFILNWADQIGVSFQNELLSQIHTSSDDNKRELCKWGLNLTEITTATQGLSMGQTPGPDGLC